MKYSLEYIAQSIDHALLQPQLDDRALAAGCELAARWAVAAVCVKSVDVQRVVPLLRNSGVATCAVVGFPHANVLTEVMCIETERALDAGATEIDAVLALSRVMSADWAAVRNQIESLQAAVARRAGLLKVILETGLFTQRDDVGRVCDICCDAGVAFVKTSTGFAIGRTPEGAMTTLGATVDDVRLLVEKARLRCRVKASGGIRTLDDAIAMLDAGANRLGTAATGAILESAARGST